MGKNKFSYTPMQQLGSLISKYGGKGHPTQNGFIWVGTFAPTSLSDTYKLKIEYKSKYYPKTYIISPKPLKMAIGAKRLPHTYDSNKQQICLFKPDFKEWTSAKLIANTIVHWAILWMFYYESWAVTGKWLGGGHGNWDVIPKKQEKELD